MPLTRQDIIDTSATLLALIAVIAGAGIVSAIAWRVWPFYRELIRIDVGARPSDGSRRFEQLDGLRGILCLMVVVHHTIITLLLPATRGDWGQAFRLARPYMRLNGIAVSTFFCVTAFLFYRRALRNVVARKPAIEPQSFFIQRVARVAPAVLLSGVIIFVLDAFGDGRYLPPNSQAFRTLLLRIVSFGATGGGKDVFYNAGVMWTLGFEWMFYLAFPLLAFACAARVPTLVLIALWFGIVVLTDGGLGGRQGLMFTPGLLAAQLAGRPAFERFARSWATSVLAAVIFVIMIATARLPNGSSILLACLMLLFPLVAAGCDLFGLLRLGSLRAIGVVSFSVYLFHGVVLYLCRPLLSEAGAFNGKHALLAFFAIAAVGVISTLLSFITFRWIEHPGIELGRRWTHGRPT